MTEIVTAPPEARLITSEEWLATGDIGPCELMDGREGGLEGFALPVASLFQ